MDTLPLSSPQFVIHDRPLDTLFNQLPSVFVPSHVATLGQLSDAAKAFGKLDTTKRRSSAEEDSNLRLCQQHQWQWRFFYIDTERLDQELEKVVYGERIDQRAFLQILETELIKVHEFYHLKRGEIQRRIAFCKSTHDPRYLKKSPHRRLSQLESEMGALPWDIQQLTHFVKTNYCSLFAVVYKYDRHLSSPARHPHDQQQTVLQNQLFRLVASKPFCDPSQLFALIASLNDLYKVTRNNQLRLVDNTPALLSTLFRNEDDADAETHYFSTRASLYSLDVPNVDGDDELRQVPNYTSIYVTHTSAPPPRIATTALPPTALPPSPATTSDGEDDDDSTSLYSTSDDTTLSDRDVLSVQQFWVHPDNLTEVMLYISKHMDMTESALPPAKVDTASRRSQYSHQSTITTLHLDTPDLANYKERVGGISLRAGKHQECKSLRVRWFEEDQRDPAVSKPVVAMEEKVYQTGSAASGYRNRDKSPCRFPEGDIFDESYRQHRRQGSKSYTRHRLWLKSKHLNPWLHGSWSLRHLLDKPHCRHRRMSLADECIEEYKDSKLHEQIIQMENDARSRHMEPVLKTMLRRTAFTVPENDLIVSIDTEIAIVRSSHAQNTGMNSDEYRRYASSASETEDYFDHQPPPPKATISRSEPYPYPSIESNDIVRFPYAVIKVSCLAKSHHRYTWLADLCSSPLLEPVHDFSTYIHGVSVLMSDKVRLVPLWKPKMDMDLSRESKQGHLIKQQLRSLSIERSASAENNLLQLPPTPWSTTPALYSPTSSNNSSSSCISSNNQSECTRATTPSSPKGKSVSEDDLLAAAMADERRPLLQKQQHSSVESYCSFDHPSSSRSDPAQCRDCIARRQSSFHKGGNSRNSSSGSLYSQYNQRTVDKDSLATHRLSRLVQTLWPSLGDIDDSKPIRPGAILPLHLPDTVSKNDNGNDKLSITGQSPRALKMTLMCGMASGAVAFLFYYILTTL
ncbi:VTC domain-containing protein [Fennellomyces sp. T-0311]|nr:VTC domain-containing protein [Fennellomyces sp. T-0311]